MMVLRFISLIAGIMISFSTFGCRSQDQSLYNKATSEALRQQPQLAKHLFLQILEAHPKPDDWRKKALYGLAAVSLDQLFEYQTGVKALETLITEFSGWALTDQEEDELRLQASRVWRLNLERPDRAFLVLEVLMKKNHLSAEYFHEFGLVFQAVRDFERADVELRKAWELAHTAKDCQRLKSLQLDLIQTAYLMKKCDQVFTWGEISLPSGCASDKVSIDFEKVNCHEVSGDFEKAKFILDEILKQDPENQRAHFFMEGLRRRQRDRMKK